MDHTFCRLMLAETMRLVREATTTDERSLAWAWGQGAGTVHEFHGPRGYVWHGQACCKWHARCLGWSAWLQAHGPDQVEFRPLGYGTLEEVAKQLPAGRWVLILDDTAAPVGMPSAWFGADTDSATACLRYTADGGTVSEATVVYVAEDGTIEKQNNFSAQEGRR